ncbi:hypothetical protein, partial [Salmonella sp. s55004]|uniref:hypothetical protein n=1 Tax=Salmonella sp. s55004 TaxID=3159675 RepID=UPI0039806FF8
SASAKVFNDAFRGKFLKKIEELFNVNHDVALWVRTDLRMFRDCSTSPCGYAEVFGFENIENEKYVRNLHDKITEFITSETGLPSDRFFMIFRKVWETNYALPNGQLLSEKSSS